MDARDDGCTGNQDCGKGVAARAEMSAREQKAAPTFLQFGARDFSAGMMDLAQVILRGNFCAAMA